MQDKPDAQELVAAVRDFLQQEIIPTLDNQRLKFRALIAANVLSILERELASDEDRLYLEWQYLAVLLGHEGEEPPVTIKGLRADIDGLKRDLCARIRAGEADAPPWRAGVLAYARWAVTAKLEVSNPRYLERVQRDRPPHVK
jgi:hypothetical protein